MAVAGEYPSLLICIPGLLRYLDRNSSRHRHIALVVQQGAACHVDGNERSRTAALNGHAGAGQIELVGNARRKEIIAVGKEKRKPVSSAVLAIEVQKIRAGKAACINANSSSVRIRVIT